MKIIDITKFNEDFNELALAKMDIENVWKTKNMTFYDFYRKLDLTYNSFVYWGEIIIPFSFVKGYNDNYLFYSGCGDSKVNEYFEDVVSTLLIKHKYNLIGALNEVTVENLIEAKVAAPDYPYFLINQKYYVMPE